MCAIASDVGQSSTRVSAGATFPLPFLYLPAANRSWDFAMGLEVTQVALGVAFFAIWALVGRIVVTDHKTLP